MTVTMIYGEPAAVLAFVIGNAQGAALDARRLEEMLVAQATAEIGDGANGGNVVALRLLRVPAAAAAVGAPVTEVSTAEPARGDCVAMRWRVLPAFDAPEPDNPLANFAY